MLTKVTRVPVTKEDLTIGFQKENQIRNAGQANYTQINAANIKGAAYINTFTELKAIDTDTVDADSLFIVRETDNIYIYRYDRNSTASEDLVYNTILVPNDNKGRFIKISGTNYIHINATNIKGVAYINTFTELKAIDTDTIDADSLFIVRETDYIYIYRYDRNSTAPENLVYNAILAPNDNKGRFIKIGGINYLAYHLPYPIKLTLNQPFKVDDDYGCVVPERYVIGESGELTIEGSGVFMVVG